MLNYAAPTYIQIIVLYGGTWNEINISLGIWYMDTKHQTCTPLFTL